MSVVHPFPPVADAACRVLILGSFPSVKSREEGFFYGHPRNRFWPLMAALLGENAPQSIPEKKAMLLRHHIALWDVIASCEITGSSDSSVKNAVPVDIAQVTELCRLERVYCNGALAAKLSPLFGKQSGLACDGASVHQPRQRGLQHGALAGGMAGGRGVNRLFS